MTSHYLSPGRADRLVSATIAALARRGVSLMGSRELSVRGRRSGEWRSVPVNLLDHDGEQYLVSARGNGHWVRNLRAAGTGELRVGRRVQPFTSVELTDAEKPPVLRAYLKRWAFEVGRFFGGVNAKSSDEEVAAIAGNHPIFRIVFPSD